MKKVIISTGGTGGHIFPALAVAKEIRRRFPECRILFVGGKYGPEGELVRQAGIDFCPLPVRGIIGRGPKALWSLCLLLYSLVKAFFLLLRFRPEVVVGFGGYAGFCVVRLACLLHIPCAIHEQNTIPGSANRILAPKVDKVFLTFPDSNFGGKEEILTGTPVREEICKLYYRDCLAENRTVSLLVLGGSQGAHILNEVVVRALGEFRRKKILLWHQTGKNDFEFVKAAYEKEYPAAKVTAFIDDMAEAYCFADLVLCRAGASTLAELSLAGKPSILVPFPYAAHDHQTKNAKMLEEIGASLVLQQSYLEELDLVKTVVNLVFVPGKLISMSVAARSFAKPQAVQKIVEEIITLSEKNKRVKK